MIQAPNPQIRALIGQIWLFQRGSTRRSVRTRTSSRAAESFIEPPPFGSRSQLVEFGYGDACRSQIVRQQHRAAG
jgi:hypothetical protein